MNILFRHLKWLLNNIQSVTITRTTRESERRLSEAPLQTRRRLCSVWICYSGPHKPFCNIQHEYQLRFHRVCIPAAGRPLWLYNVLVVVFVIKNWMLWDHTDDEILPFSAEIKVFISLTYISADVEVPHVTVPLRCAYIKSVLINVHADSGERVCCVLTCFV